MFRRLAVVTRGEPPLRLIRAVRELNAKHGHGANVIPVHTEAERRATLVRTPDEAVLLRRTGLLAKSTGVPVLACVGGPLIVEARSGGGGRGNRIVGDESEADGALERTESEALRAFADHLVSMERLVEGARHIEVQVVTPRCSPSSNRPYASPRRCACPRGWTSASTTWRATDRARRMGSVHAIVPVAELRPRLSRAVDPGLAGT